MEAHAHADIDKFHSFLKSGKVTRSQAEVIWRKLSADEKRDMTVDVPIKPAPPTKHHKDKNTRQAKIEDLSSEESEIELSATKRPRRQIASDSEDEELKVQPKKHSSIAAKFTWK